MFTNFPSEHFCLLLGCGNSYPDEIAIYTQQIRNFKSEEQTIIKTYENVTGENFTSDNALRDAFEEIIPKTRNLIKSLESITPPSQFQPTHEKIIRGWNLYSDAFVIFPV